jgi:hypothetical protein
MDLRDATRLNSPRPGEVRPVSHPTVERGSVRVFRLAIPASQIDRSRVFYEHVLGVDADDTVPSRLYFLSVNGSSASGACGVAGTSGTFTVIRRNASQAIIDVTSTTKFRDPGVTSPSFADLCVNETARAVGTLSAGVLNANVVHIFAAPPTA